MRSTLTFITSLFALASITQAVSIDDRSATVKRDPKTFRLYRDHLRQEQCVPGICGGNTVDVIKITVHDDCNGGGCNGVSTVLDSEGGSLCDQDFPQCDRTLKLVSRGPDDCRPMSDLSEADNGIAYATLVEGDKEVGTCSVDFSIVSSSSCVFAGGVEMASQVFCAFNDGTGA